jgi:predicted XRE-type DNA-binding protein
MKKKIDYEVSSGNVFADLGLSHPEELIAKANLAYQINSLIQEKNLTQTAAAKLLDIDQPKISALHTGKLSGFSIERLFRFLNILDQDITIKISPKKRSKKRSEIIVTTKIRSISKKSSLDEAPKRMLARKKPKNCKKDS